VTDGGLTKNEAWNLQIQAKAMALSELERDMLLDFAGLETGKVCGGAAMWMIAKDFCRSKGLMEGWPSAKMTPLGREVAQLIHAHPTLFQKEPSDG